MVIQAEIGIKFYKTYKNKFKSVLIIIILYS